ncbi:helix-turn-helix domain-containing protein [Micromonospora sp. MED01]|uniref:helix-turn-helix transcriptional regulator n=1 Tax=Micromonospora alfalfae TaxID=2911212 RepID=UPI001EE8B9BB|nr:helix-turn-helix domain-containing protein [Micromonospora alfalfae]MCG5464144.1 helix-turn-helix domain-containing protein [Micromonospora alfalfae]
MNADTPLTLPEVAALTGLSLRSIERGCRNGTIEHTPIGDGTIKQHRRMYPHQVEKLLEARRQGATQPLARAGTQPPEVEPVDPLAEARAASRRLNARRLTGRAA